MSRGQIRPRQFRIRQIHLLQFGADQLSVDQRRLHETAELKIATRQLRVRQVRPAEVQSLKVSAAPLAISHSHQFGKRRRALASRIRGVTEHPEIMLRTRQLSGIPPALNHPRVGCHEDE